MRPFTTSTMSAAATTSRTDESLIRAAIAAAGMAGSSDVPIGAVVVDADGVELARAANAREALGDPTAHAEILALREAARVHGDGWHIECEVRQLDGPEFGVESSGGADVLTAATSSGAS